MAIDIRATVTCSLGTLISGSISDDYIQGSGLVKTKGSIELSGIVTPAVGTAVTFTYTKGGVVRSIPRKLRVLSSFADPFRRTTQVELGCKLTYLADLKPAPTVEGDANAETGKRQQCLNGYLDYPADSSYGIRISAAQLMTTCLTRLGITASSNPLTNYFNQSSFDLTPGYVTILSDLLLSESYCGYLDTNEVLQVFSLDQGGGTGPVINQSNIIDIAGIGIGQLPADAVVVRYQSVKLNQDLETEDPTSQSYQQRNWEYEETVGSVQCVPIRYTSSNVPVTASYCYIPFTKTTTYYGQDLSWDPNTCVLASASGNQPDLSNSVTRRVTTTRTLKAEQAGDYCAKLLSAGVYPGAGVIADTTVEETYSYDSKGQVTLQTTKTWEPFFAWAGRLNLDVFFSANDYVQLGSGQVLVSEVIVSTEYLYAPAPTGAYIKVGDVLDPAITGQKVVTTTYTNWGLSQQGQQAIAGIRENAPFTNSSQVANFLNEISGIMVLGDQAISTNRNRSIAPAQTRPAIEDRQINAADTSNAGTETTSELIYVSGSPLSDRIVEFSMPYQSDDYYTATGTLVKSDAAAKASRYGRCQNRLLLGNRNGMNLQLAPETLPAAPFSPIVVQANGLSALYRVNGTNWQLSSEGVLVSTDALFWGAVGGTGTFWFPVAPGITTLPAEPPVVGGSMTVTNVVPVWNETVLLTGTLRVGVGVQSLPYAINLLTIGAPTTIRLGLGVVSITSVTMPSAIVAVEAPAPLVVTDQTVYAPVADIGLLAASPAISTVLSPTFYASGTAGFGSGSVTYALPAGYQANDIAVLAFETYRFDSDPTSITGWTAAPDMPVYGFDSKLQVWWKRLSASETNPTVPDLGDHQVGFISVFRGCATSGNPWDVTTTGEARNNANPASIPAVTTTVAGALIVMYVTHSQDTNTLLFSDPQNNNLSGLALQMQASSGAGTGGGIALVTGLQNAAGSTGVTQITLATESDNCFCVLALRGA